MVDKQDNQVSVRHQCELLAVPRQRLYYKPRPISDETLCVMDFIDRRFTEHPTLGVDVMVEHIYRDMRLVVNHKRMRRLMRTMGLMAIYPKPRTSSRPPCITSIRVFWVH